MSQESAEKVGLMIRFIVTSWISFKFTLEISTNKRTSFRLDPIKYQKSQFKIGLMERRNILSKIVYLY